MSKPSEKVLEVLRKAGQHFLSDKEFREQFDEAKGYAVGEYKGDLTMQFWLYGTPMKSKTKETKKAVMPVLMGDWNPKDDVEKQKIMQGIGLTFNEKFPGYMLTTVVQMSEAWMVQRDFDHPKEDSYIMPSQSPNKIEVVIVDALSMDQRHSFYTGQIKRDWKGDFVSIETKIEEVYDPKKKPEFTEAENRLTLGIFQGAWVGDLEKEAKNGTT